MFIYIVGTLITGHICKVIFGMYAGVLYIHKQLQVLHELPFNNFILRAMF